MADFALTPADVKRLLADPSEKSRASVAIKLADDLKKEVMTPEEQKIAQEIIRAFAKDTATLVRQSVADSMRASRHLPPDVAEALAQDIESISIPMLQDSPILSDAFLIRVVREQNEARQSAIAARAQISSQVVSTLVEKGTENVVNQVVHNPNATLDEASAGQVLERFPHSYSIVDGLATHPTVPSYILEYLVAQASDALKIKIQSRPDYQKRFGEVIIQARERATLYIIGTGRSDEELGEVAEQLIETNRMTASLVLRTLCLGNLKFFEVCMATAANVPLKNARILIYDQGDAGFQAIYIRTGLSTNFFPAIRHALDIARETEFDGGPDDLVRYRKRLVERILTDSQGMTAEDIEYLLDKLGDLEAVSDAA